jgi:hypothetical protein
MGAAWLWRTSTLHHPSEAASSWTEADGEANIEQDRNEYDFQILHTMVPTERDSPGWVVSRL